jgi:DeoD family purine-nucleoside phosphorylase
LGPDTIHLQPTASLAERVLLPGDPGRALALAQTLLDEPRMFNHNRGLWGYTGTAADGSPLTIQSTGMGGPSAAIVIEELVRLGARRLIRVGTCGALVDGLELGGLLVAEVALAADGTGSRLGGSTTAPGDGELTARLRYEAGPAATAGLVVSTDLFYDEEPARATDWISAGALAVDMETATLFALAGRRAVRAACILAVSDLILPGGERRRLDAEAIAAAGARLGSVAAAALAQE